LRGDSPPASWLLLPSSSGIRRIAPPPHSGGHCPLPRHRGASSVSRCHTRDHVPPSWFLTTSTVYSSRRFGCFAIRDGHGVCYVSGPALRPSGEPDLRTTGPFPATRFIPLEEFPSTAAAPHHCGRCLLAVTTRSTRSNKPSVVCCDTEVPSRASSKLETPTWQARWPRSLTTAEAAARGTQPAGATEVTSTAGQAESHRKPFATEVAEPSRSEDLYSRPCRHRETMSPCGPGKSGSKSLTHQALEPARRSRPSGFDTPKRVECEEHTESPTPIRRPVGRRRRDGANQAMIRPANHRCHRRADDIVEQTPTG
jgi:hypothetical protein